MNIFKSASIAALSLISLPALAATHVFNVTVVESVDHPLLGLDLPDIGATGTIGFTLDAATLNAER